MAQLSKVVAAILRDMNLAQYEADRYALRLAGAMRTNGAEAGLPPTAAALNAMEITLRYGVGEGCTDALSQEVDFSALRRLIADLAPRQARLAVDSFQTAVASPGLLRKGGPAAKLRDDHALCSDFVTFLSRRLSHRMLERISGLVGQDGKPDVKIWADTASDAVCETIFAHSEFSGLFSGPSGGVLRKKVESQLRKAMQTGVAAIPMLQQTLLQESLPSLDVVVSSRDMAELPESTIHTLRMQIAPRELLPKPSGNE